MSIDVLMPKFGFASGEAVLSEWVVADGDHVNEGQHIYNAESDKSMTEVEAPGSGTITILIENGTACAVGTTVATIR